jgi:hypothetical protein
MSYFNSDQCDYMRDLASLPREAKCDCGWAPRGECFGDCHGKPEKGGAVPGRVPVVSIDAEAKRRVRTADALAEGREKLARTPEAGCSADQVWLGGLLDALVSLCVRQVDGGCWVAFEGFGPLGDALRSAHETEEEARVAVLRRAEREGGRL